MEFEKILNNIKEYTILIATLTYLFKSCIEYFRNSRIEKEKFSHALKNSTRQKQYEFQFNKKNELTMAAWPLIVNLYNISVDKNKSNDSIVSCTQILKDLNQVIQINKPYINEELFNIIINFMNMVDPDTPYNSVDSKDLSGLYNQIALLMYRDLFE